MGIVTALLALQPDLGATVVVLAIIMGILFLGGISYVILGVVGSMVITMGVGMIIAHVATRPRDRVPGSLE